MLLAFNHNCSFTCALHNKNTSFKTVNGKMLYFCNNNTAIFMKNSFIFSAVYREDTLLQVAHYPELGFFDFLESVSQNRLIIWILKSWHWKILGIPVACRMVKLDQKCCRSGSIRWWCFLVLFRSPCTGKQVAVAAWDFLGYLWTQMWPYCKCLGRREPG